MGAWSEVADSLRLTFGARNAFLRIHNNDGVPGALESTATMVDAGRRRDYAEHYWMLDFSLKSLLRHPVGKVVHLAEMRANSTLAKSEYYIDWLKYYDVDHMIDCLAPIANGMFIRFGVSRSCGQQPFEQGDVQIMSDLVPLLQRAFRLRPLTASHGLRPESAMDFDTMADAIIVLDGDGQVSDLNLGAQLMTGRGSGLVLSGNRARCRDPGAGAHLRSLIESVAHADRPAVAGESRIISEDRERTLTVLVARMPVGEAGELKTVLLLAEAGRGRSSGKVDFARWGLTPREAELAGAMMEGARLVAAAKQIKISHETARFHLKNIYSKLGVHSQAGLVRRLITDEQDDRPGETVRRAS
jgi:DNA-binding CsgD family transcriptional regulator